MTVSPTAETPRPAAIAAHRTRRGLRARRGRLGLRLSTGWVVALGLAAIFADFLPLAEGRNASKALLEPTRMAPHLLSRHPLGTDTQGLDLLAGVIYGGRVSLSIGLGAVVIGIAVGGAVGLLAGFYGKKVDSVISLLTNSMLAFPPLIMLLAMVTVLKPNSLNVSVALAVISIPTFIRLSRANTMLFSQRGFVVAARALGATNRRVIIREIVPNVLLPLASYGLIVVSVVIVAESSLSFLGLSIPRPNPTWGNMIAAGQSEVSDHPHLVYVPAAALLFTVLALNRLGDEARRRWDPRQSKV